MRIWVFSDLHLEYAQLHQPLDIPEADVCVMAGDLMRAPANGVHWLGEHIARWMPVIFVAGNHEFYKGSIKESLEDGRAAAERFPDVHFLENDFVVIDGVRFIGATLWTDYRIEGHQQLAMHNARERVNDHKLIALQRNPWKRFLPMEAVRLHSESRLFIESALKADRDIPTVVVTHHLPSMKSVAERFRGDALNAAFASDLDDLIEMQQPDLWVHGHTHDSADYRIGDTRVVCNPRGYDDENPAFKMDLVVEIDGPTPLPGIGGSR
ncbi:metallophosphoesterase [Mesorhizobium sp. A623]